jgi:hypothetical protein
MRRANGTSRGGHAELWRFASCSSFVRIQTLPAERDRADLRGGKIVTAPPGTPVTERH